MKKLFAFVTLSFLAVCFSCKKIQENIAEKTVMQAITEGRWVVLQYKTPTTDFTPDFSGYEFQFYNNNSVQAFLGSTSTDGTWAGDLMTLSISANFPSASLPVSRLNGTWKVTENSYSDVKAYSLSGTDTTRLALHKK